MSRIGKMYETRFRALLQELNARRTEKGVPWLVSRAEQLSRNGGHSLTHALVGIGERLRRQVGTDYA